jgi:hypothetical protein
MTVNQGDIIELNFELPNGKFKIHPALVISNQNVLDILCSNDFFKRL